MTQNEQWQQMLDDTVFDAIVAAEECGEPITLNRGARFGKTLKQKLKVSNVHESLLCASLKRLLEQGRVVETTIEMVDGMYGSGLARKVPRVSFTAAPGLLPSPEMEPHGLALARA